MMFHLLFIIFLYYKQIYDIIIERDLFIEYRSLIFLILAKRTV